jgi:hypothetical protein
MKLGYQLHLALDNSIFLHLSEETRLTLERAMDTTLNQQLTLCTRILGFFSSRCNARAFVLVGILKCSSTSYRNQNFGIHRHSMESV